MKNSIVNCLKRKRGAKDWCAIAVLTFAVSVELADAAFGINGLTSGADLAASNVVDVADMLTGATATWVLHA